jgi:hypothetical protein
MSFWSAALGVLSFIWLHLSNWLYIFISPIKNLEILWIIVPIWISWFFAEFFQEKRGTSFGNAISNGAIPLWVGIDWTRYLTNTIVEEKLRFSWLIFAKYSLCTLIIIYGLSIIIFGIQGKNFIKYFGRIREITYILLVFSPVIYGILKLSWTFIAEIIIFFPIYYFLIELLDIIIPDPKVIELDTNSQDNSRQQINSQPFPPTQVNYPQEQPFMQQNMNLGQNSQNRNDPFLDSFNNRR